VHFSVQKLLSKYHTLKTADFSIPEFPLAINKRGLVNFFSNICKLCSLLL
jgi:hypothetical protein